MAQLKTGIALQPSLFEDEYLVRSLGALGYKPEMALTELVANAWDAGASEVSVDIPDRLGGELSVSDDGCGMTPDLFRKRWMTLGYDRLRHQGATAEFPPERHDWRRRAYGHNGVGRHGLLCFGSKYIVETWREGLGARFVVGTTAGNSPFQLEDETPVRRKGHGTRLSVIVRQHLPGPDRILEILAARFLHDPRFRVSVNGKSVPLWEHTGLIEERSIQISPTVTLRTFFVDATQAGRTTQYQGVAFWVGGRLVGEPSWIVGKQSLLDGRTRLAKQYTSIVMSDDLHEEVLPDWSGFRDSEVTHQVYEATAAYVAEVIARLSTERREETRTAIVREHEAQMRDLQPLARVEVTEFIDSFTIAQPQATPEIVSSAVQAVINLEKSRTGRALLEKLGRLSEEDVEGLDRLLSDWTIRDALTVLGEIDNRLLVLEAVERLSTDPRVDELHTLHPLVTQARWLFGAEFDSPEYAANVSLSTAMRTLLSTRITADAFLNARRRPDLIVLGDATVSATATEQIDDDTGLATLKDVLVVELKRGGSQIGREEVNQATGYVEDLIHSGHLDGAPFIRAFVVGHSCQDKVERTRKVGEPERGWVRVATFTQLVRTGKKRLFNLRDRLKTRYSQLSGEDLLEAALGPPSQLELPVK
jgi:hypothetical protein